ncbi:MAG: DUF937 domain-containing protein [Pseudomonadota bacterium]
MNLTQLLVTQDNVDALSQQFGLSEEQTLEAMGALIPAFSEGLKRNASNPASAAGLIEALATGRHSHYASDPHNAMSSFGVRDGEAILGHLFGNKDVSRAVASHAAGSSGIGSSILKQMLPVIASMVMGSLFKGATGSRSRSGGGLGGALGQAAGGGLLGTLIEGLAGGMLGGAKQQARRRAPRRRGNTGGGLEDLLGDLLGGGRRSAPRRTTQRSTTRQRRAPDPIMPPGTPSRRRQSGGNAFDELLGGGRRRGSSPYAKPASRSQPRPRRRSGGGLGEIFGDLLEAGGNTSRDYQRSTKSVFDELLGPN